MARSGPFERIFKFFSVFFQRLQVGMGSSGYTVGRSIDRYELRIERRSERILIISTMCYKYRNWFDYFLTFNNQSAKMLLHDRVVYRQRLQLSFLIAVHIRRERSSRLWIEWNLNFLLTILIPLMDRCRYNCSQWIF